MRGREHRAKSIFRPGRITPAYAGKSRAKRNRSTCDQDHPRVCGEESWNVRDQTKEEGSPPRMRGRADFDVCPDRQCGITPAYAGKRSRPEYCNGRNQDHPRVCGEEGEGSAQLPQSGGSPPRMRGRVLAAGLDNLIDRITPAYAGKRCGKLPFPWSFRDHPRVCGEETKKIP